MLVNTPALRRSLAPALRAGSNRAPSSPQRPAASASSPHQAPRKGESAAVGHGFAQLGVAGLRGPARRFGSPGWSSGGVPCVVRSMVVPTVALRPWRGGGASTQTVLIHVPTKWRR